MKPDGWHPVEQADRRELRRVRALEVDADPLALDPQGRRLGLDADVTTRRQCANRLTNDGALKAGDTVGQHARWHPCRDRRFEVRRRQAQPLAVR